MVDGFTRTPRYVLKDGAYPTCPSILQASSGDHATVIFGFSDKPKCWIRFGLTRIQLRSRTDWLGKSLRPVIGLRQLRS